MDGHDLTLGQSLWLEFGSMPEDSIYASPRVGVRGDEHARTAPWRFFLAENPHVSPTPLNRQGTEFIPSRR